MATASSPRGAEFRNDLRPLGRGTAGSGNAAARRILGADELAPLTRLDDRRSLCAIAQTAGVIALAVGFGLWAWPSPWASPQLRAAARSDRWLVVAFQIGVPLVAWALGGARGLVQYAVLWVLPLLTVLQPILRLRAVCEHGAVTDLSSPLTAARTNQTEGGIVNRIARVLLFPHHVNYHLEHHLYPAVPHYHLPRLHRLLVGKGVLEGAEVRDVAETLRCVFAPPRAHRTGAQTP